MSDGLTGSLQDNILTLVCYSDEDCKIVRATVGPELFTSRAYREIINRAYAYIDKFDKAPGQHIADELEDLLKQDNEQAELIAEVLEAAHELWPTINREYVREQLERYVRQQSLKVGIVQAHELVAQGNLDEAELVLAKASKARSDSFTPGMTLNSVVKSLRNPDDQREPIYLGIEPLDRLQLGPAKQELHLLIAPPKRGKSWWLAHCTKHAILQRWKGVVVTLELRDKFWGKRMIQSLFSATSRVDAEVMIPRMIKDSDGKLESIEQQIKPRPSVGDPAFLAQVPEKLEWLRLEDRLLIKGFPTGTLTVRGLEAYLDVLDRTQGFVPDFVVLDYADLMRVDTKNYRIDLGNLYKDLRGLAVERNLALITASQSNRGGSTARLVRDSDVAEDYSKIATADCVMTYNQTLMERRRGLARLFVASGRVEADRFSVVVTQSYTAGQFALDSWLMGDEYWDVVDDREEDDDD